MVHQLLLLLLLQSGANYNQVNFRGNSPLHEAVSGNKLEVARVLLEAGAFVMVTNNKHLTPLQLAVVSIVTWV